MRQPFTDGFNSFWHLVLGMIAPWFWPLVPVFVLYQFQASQIRNRYIDLLEFFVGTAIVLAALKSKDLGKEPGAYEL
jgi:hypothetical protein